MSPDKLAYLIADAIRAGADAADRIDPCAKCGAPAGEQCVTSTKGEPWGKSHAHRLPGDPVLSFALRAIASRLEYHAVSLEFLR